MSLSCTQLKNGKWLIFFIPQIDSVFIILGSFSCCSYSWNVFIPQSSHFGRAMEVAVKGKSPSYLHLFPHSSAGDRGGFSKPGGKLTSITLVSPLKP